MRFEHSVCRESLMTIYIIYKCIIILINFVIATISFILNVAGDLPDLQVPPQPCSIKNKTDSDNIEPDDNNNNNNNKINNNDMIIIIAITRKITIITIQINKVK